jgi:rhodanese-related sulfurtransferase
MNVPLHLRSCVLFIVTELKASLSLDPDQFKAKFNSVKPAKDDQNIVFYGYCSIKSTTALEIAHKLGFKKYVISAQFYAILLTVSRYRKLIV